MLYAFTLFWSALLLFGVQPMVGKFALPRFGGTPSVWTACMLFFQTLLLAGYAYAHGVSRRLSLRRQALTHMGLIGLGLALLLVRALLPGPFFSMSTEVPSAWAQVPTLRLLWLLTCSVGLPFFVLSSTAPLLQSWLAHQYPGSSPYRLYALSNAGSLLSLLSFPFLIEPFVSRTRQGQLFGWGFLVFAVACAACARSVLKVAGGQQAEQGDREGAREEPEGSRVAGQSPVHGDRSRTMGTHEPILRQAQDERGEAQDERGEAQDERGEAQDERGEARDERGEAQDERGEAQDERGEARDERGGQGLWFLLSATGSTLLLATSQRLAQDVAAGPFLWVIPLALYLLTFMLTFERASLYRRWFWFPLFTLSLCAVVRAYYAGPHWALPLQVASLAAALFTGCMVCHGELYRQRPPPRFLSGFYLWTSIGGAAGGLFVGALAPQLFHTYVEYPLALGACGFILLVVLITPAENPARWLRVTRLLTAAGIGVLITLLAVAHVDVSRNARSLQRNFFGVVKVFEQERKNPLGHRFVLQNGAILHGVQQVDPLLRKQPTTYFTEQSGLGLAFQAQRLQHPDRPLRVGVLGLGIGTSVALARAGDTVVFYEIDPQVIALAQGQGSFFSYLKDSEAHVQVVEGDARISLEHELAQSGSRRFDILALDVFSSDAIPLHLMTEEALSLYLAHLAPDGVLALHISNLHVDLKPVSLTHAQTLGLHAVLVSTDAEGLAQANHWMLLSATEPFFQRPPFIQAGPRVVPMRLGKHAPVRWTDELSSLLPVLRKRALDP